MDIVVDRKRFIDVLQKISAPTTTKTTFPIFSTVLIDISGKKINFTTTDLELTLTSQMQIKQETQKTFCVSLAKLLSILKEFNQEQVSLKPQKGFLWITCENCELKLNIINPEEFPKQPQFRDKQVIKVLTQTLREMIRLVSFSVFIGEGNYVLSGVLAEIEKDTIKFVSTDGKRLSLIERNLPKTQPELNTKKKFIIPYKTIIELNKLLKDINEEELILVFRKNQINFDLHTTQLTSQLIEGEFPEYEKYIPQESQNKLKVDRVKLLSSLRRANILSAPDYQGVKLDMSKSKLIVSKTTPQLGEYKEEIEVEYKGKSLSLGFNPDYLIDVLKVVEEDEVVFDIYDVEKPITLRNDGYIYLALPMRL